MIAQATTLPSTHLPTHNQETIESFRNQFSGELIQPGDPTYDSARRVWNGMIDKYPALIARCRSVADVVTAVNFGRRNNILVSVRGGGHNVAGNAVCDGGLVIDLSPLRTVTVDPEARTVRVAAGATIGEVDRATQPYGLATPTGNVSETGIAGLTLSGGLSWLRRKYGMNIDSLLGAEVVTADGRVLWASATDHADLFWGIRGGGGNFGIITSFEFRLYPVGPEVSFLSILYPYALARKVLTAWRSFTTTAPDEVSSDVLLWEIPDAPIFPEAIQGERIVGLGAVHVGPVDEGMRLLQPLRELGEPLVDMSGPLPYVAVQSAFDPLFPAHERRYYWKSLYLDHLDDQVFDALLRWNETRPSPRTFIPIRHLGGAISRVGETETAVSNRQSPFLLSIDMTWDNPEEDARNIAWTQAFWREMHRFSSEGGVYLNFAGLGEEGQRMLQAAHGANYQRLVALKNKYDPTNFFRLNQNVPPSV
jgi:FAD/FMN-containing dehydrogenase